MSSERWNRALAPLRRSPHRRRPRQQQARWPREAQDCQSCACGRAYIAGYTRTRQATERMVAIAEHIRDCARCHRVYGVASSMCFWSSRSRCFSTASGNYGNASIGRQDFESDTTRLATRFPLRLTQRRTRRSVSLPRPRLTQRGLRWHLPQARWLPRISCSARLSHLRVLT